MRKFELFRSKGDGLNILVEFEINTIINTIQGDCYHDKINHYIDGYLDGISEFDKVEVTEFWIDIDDELEFIWEVERKKKVKTNTYILGENNF